MHVTKCLSMLLLAFSLVSPRTYTPPSPANAHAAAPILTPVLQAPPWQRHRRCNPHNECSWCLCALLLFSLLARAKLTQALQK